jgi:hypothetical protein
VKPITDHNDVDQNIHDLERTAAALHDEVAAARTLPEGAFHDPAFIRRRFERIVAELDAAQTVIARQLRQLQAHDGPPAPPEVLNALAARGHSVRPVDVTVNGRQLTIGVPALGITDPTEANRRWRKLLEKYGHGSEGRPR